jgi:hypothetical protein
MKKNDDPVFGPYIGRLGNVVSCYRYGKHYLRTLPEKVRQPDTPAQLARRMRFRLVQEYLQPLKAFLRMGFGGYAAGRSAWSAAMSYNLKNALTDKYPHLAVDPGKVLLSRGLLPAADGVSLAGEPARLLLTWSPDDEGNSSDNVAMIAFCQELKHAVWVMEKAKRKDGAAVLNIPPARENRNMAGFICFYSTRILSDGIKPGLISDSCYAGTLMAGPANES